MPLRRLEAALSRSIDLSVTTQESYEHTDLFNLCKLLDPVLPAERRLGCLRLPSCHCMQSLSNAVEK